MFLFMLLGAFLAFLCWRYVGSSDGLSPNKPRAQWPGLALAALISIALLVPICWAIRRRELTLTDTALDFRCGFYRKIVPLSQLRMTAAREISLIERPELAPRWRTNAIGLPGYRVGWFRLRNGDKALVYLTDPLRVTYLPTAEGFVFLLSTGALLDALEQRVASLTPLASPAGSSVARMI